MFRPKQETDNSTLNQEIVTVHCSQEEFKRIIGSSVEIKIKLLLPSANLKDVPPPVKKIIMEFLPNPAQLLVNKEFNYLFNNATKLQIQSLHWQMDVALPNYFPKRKKAIEQELKALYPSMKQGWLERCCDTLSDPWPYWCTSQHKEYVAQGVTTPGCGVLGWSGIIDSLTRSTGCCCGGKALTCMTTSVGGIEACSGPSCCNPIATPYVVGYSMLGCGLLSACCYCFVTSSAEKVTSHLRHERQVANAHLHKKWDDLITERNNLINFVEEKQKNLLIKFSVLTNQKPPAFITEPEFKTKPPRQRERRGSKRRY